MPPAPGHVVYKVRVPVGRIAHGLVRAHEHHGHHDSDSKLEGEGEGKEEDAGPPLDPDGAACVLALDLPLGTAEDLVSHLRTNLCQLADTTEDERKASVDDLTHSRVGSYTEELEARLRSHWPRKGKAEVTMRQPREAELLGHAQKLSRHVAKFTERATVLAESFMDALQEARAFVGDMRTKQNTLAKQLPQQTSVAGVQGVQQRSKQTLLDLRAGMEDWRNKLRVFMGPEASRVLQLNQDFLRTCVSFDDGGDYDVSETQTCRESLQNVEGTFDTKVQERSKQLEALEELFNTTVELFGDAFTKNVEACVENISMEQGMGKKYGEPRRSAQEVIRSECAWSDEAEAAIGARLEELQALVGVAAGAQSTVPLAGDSRLVTPESPLNLRIQASVVQLRDLMFKRAAFLEALLPSPPRRNLPMPLITVADKLGSDEAPPSSTAEDAKPVTKTFMSAVTAALELGKELTKKLYAAEGKPIASDDKLPESFKAYVAQQSELCGEVRIQACLRLREQASRLQTLLLDAPAVGIADAALRLMKAAAQDNTTLGTQYSREAGELRRQLDEHNILLTPQLADPNKAAELNALCAREVARVEAHKQTLARFRKLLLTSRVQAAGDFLRALAFTSNTYFALADGCLMDADFAPLPGDELRVADAVSLKRLRKQFRKLDVESKLSEDALDLPEGFDPKALTTRKWAGVRADVFSLPDTPAWSEAVAPPSPVYDPLPAAAPAAAPAAPAAGAGAGGKAGAKAPAAAAKAPAGGAGKGKEAPAPVVESATPPGESPAVTTLYTSATRHIVKARDEWHARYKEEFVAATGAISDGLAQDWEAVLKAELSWNTNVGKLRLACAEP